MFKEIDPYTVRYWIAYAAYLSLSNLIWEAAQLPLYTLWDQDINTIVFSIIHCTGGDVLIGMFSLGIAWVSPWARRAPKRPSVLRSIIRPWLHSFQRMVERLRAEILGVLRPDAADQRG
mgnify:CR=1 FL=1